MKQPTFNGRELLPLSVMEAAHAGDAIAMEQVLRYYDCYINKLCTQSFQKRPGVVRKPLERHSVNCAASALLIRPAMAIL